MRDRSIREPNEVSPANAEPSVKDIAESISYFLAGSLLIWIVLAPKLSNTLALGPMEWLTVTVGGLLVIGGFASLVIIPFQKRIADSQRMLISTIRRHMGATAFAITLFTLGIVVLGFRDFGPLYIAGLVFLFIVMVSIVALSWSSVFKDSALLMRMPVALNTIAIIMLFAGASVRELVTILVISLIFIVLALRKASQPTGSS